MWKREAKLRGPFQGFGQHGWVASGPSGGDDSADRYRSRMCLFEDGARLSQGHMPHSAIAAAGGGRYSHWQRRIFFSTTDGSDPNTNGRTYSYDFSLDPQTWNEERLARSVRRWDLHADGDFFRRLGGDMVPPPLVANLGLTNKCNLRCEICGSQKYLDQTGVRRRHMSLRTFEDVAATIFPFLSVVELNSQGDPLLHPNIETVLARVAEHRCDIKIQHNGTLLSDNIVELLLRQHGTIMLWLDAVGAKFDEVRRGGSWTRAEPGLNRLLAARDRRRLSVGVYPTLTRRTIGEALNVLEWSAERAADTVAFHRYVPVAGADEESPTDKEYQSVREELRKWCSRNGDPLRVLFESETLNNKQPPLARTEYASTEKAAAISEFLYPTFPTENRTSEGDPEFACVAPRDYAEIGLEGQISVCCRSQDVPLGYATSSSRFAAAWLGENYQKIRNSLHRSASGPYPLPNCDACMKFFAPGLAGQRRAFDYSANQDPDGLRFEAVDEVRIEEIRKETGLCHIAIIPPGLDATAFELWEDDRRLGPAGTLHDEIRQFGGGRYHIGLRSVYFSTSDGSDGQRNQRVYTLKARPKSEFRADES